MITGVNEDFKKIILFICMLCVLCCTIFCGAHNTQEQADNIINAYYSSDMPLEKGRSEHITFQSKQSYLMVSEVKDLREVVQRFTYGKQLSRNINATVVLLVLYLIILFSLFLYIPCMSLWREKPLVCEGLVSYIHDKDGMK